MENFTETVEGIRRQHIEYAVWIGGDCNLGDINWDTHTVMPFCSQAKLTQSIHDLVEDQSLTQMVDLPTRKERKLDLFLTENTTLVNMVITLPPQQVMDHSIAFVDVDTRVTIQPKPATVVYISTNRQIGKP